MEEKSIKIIPANILFIFKPVKGYFISPLIITLNVAVFIIMVLSGVNILNPDVESLISWGANFKPMTLNGEWGRLVTSCFIHIGILHLLMNMYALLYIGLLLEPYLGWERFIVAYFFTGIMASFTSIWWNDLIVSAGASGAIFGMYGVFLSLLTTNLIEKSARKTLLTSITIFVGYNLIYGLKGEIDNAAHIGGLITGLLIGYAYYPSLKKTESVYLKISTIVFLTIVFFTTSSIIYKKIPNDIGKYEQGMKEFITKESKALGFYQLSQDTPKDKILSEIKDSGLYYWNENIKLISDLDKLNLPIKFHDINKKLILYCKLRVKTYELIYQSIAAGLDTSQYSEQIEDYDKQISAIMNELAGKK